MNTQTESGDRLHRIRHSLAHVLAQAVLELRPESTLGFGPPIDNGFYYDFILSSPITEDDFPKIEKKMKQIIKRSQVFEREELTSAEALAKIEEMGEPHKLEYARELIEKRGLDSLSFYTNGPFLDMCEGPHVENTRELPAGGFKLRSIAGAYWRGDSDNVMMTRFALRAGEPHALGVHRLGRRPGPAHERDRHAGRGGHRRREGEVARAGDAGGRAGREVLTPASRPDLGQERMSWLTSTIDGCSLSICRSSDRHDCAWRLS